MIGWIVDSVILICDTLFFFLTLSLFFFIFNIFS